jgi:hypothetical protein
MHKLEKRGSGGGVLKAVKQEFIDNRKFQGE